VPYVNHTPRLRRHKPSEQAVVTLNGRDHYLGSWPATKRKPPELARQAYDALVAEWLSNGRSIPQRGVQAVGTVNDLILAFWKHAERHYRDPDGRPTSELDGFRHSLRPLRELYGTTPAIEFSPLKLKALRQKMLDADLYRSLINQRIRRIVRMFKWAVSEERVPETVYRALTTVRGPEKGRSEARGAGPVKPVPVAFVEATLPYLLPPVRAMVELQRLTGMRPGGACLMRACDLDMTGDVWLYRPLRHKTAHRGKERIIGLGPKAQETVKPFLSLSSDWISRTAPTTTSTH
jgi:integrase